MQGTSGVFTTNLQCFDLMFLGLCGVHIQPVFPWLRLCSV